MQRHVFLLLLATAVIAPVAHAQRDLDDVKVVKRKRPTISNAIPKGPVKAKVVTNGVLFVFTELPAANVVVKNSRGERVKQGPSDADGEFRAELAPGIYDVEVSNAGYYTYSSRGNEVRPPEPKIVRADLKPTTGSIIIGISQIDMDGATILINDKNPADMSIKVIKKKEANQIALENVAEGSYTLTVKHPRIVPYRNEGLKVEGGSDVFVTPQFKMLVVNFIINSEPGATIFIDGNNVGRVPEDGLLKVSRTYDPGRHTIRAELQEKYEPNQVTDNYESGDRTVKVSLGRIKTASEFNDAFESLAFWDAPRGWQVNRGKLSVVGPEVGLLRDKVYTDFKLELDISFVNAKGAAWIVRARDKQNFYLFHLAVSKGATHKFRTYVYQNGQARMIDTKNIVETLSKPNDQFHITVEAKGTTIKHYIQIKSAPTLGTQLISTITDPTFSWGLIGFTSKEGEEFFVYPVTIIPEPEK